MVFFFFAARTSSFEIRVVSLIFLVMKFVRQTLAEIPSHHVRG
jgi:hypothetical protein